MASKDLSSLTSSELRSFLNSFDTVLCDCDGVLWNVETPVPGVKETFQKLKQCGKQIGFVTNNNVFGAIGVYKNVTKIDSEFEIDSIVVPSQPIIAYLKSLQFNKEAFVLGSEIMKREFVEAGIKVSEKKINTTGQIRDLVNELLVDNENIGAVVVDYDIHINYLSLVQACILLKQKDMLFISGATDSKVYFAKNLILPGPQSFLNALIDAVDQKPISFGKPSLQLSKFIEAKYNIQDSSRVLFIGDSITQDIEFGSISGYQTLLVLTGITSIADIKDTKNASQIPNYFINSLGNLSELIENKLGL
ncbi:hypothetical protein RN001_003560 [Aquatica leii]|uniref:4-nitrophenylphosphatase n=1 Tax=Aquatica leii TaxID=1421715 RepID=A0AAN7PII2_9COLE|nr:hypothetical protein RN001_003560 [Aquatica leii]